MKLLVIGVCAVLLSVTAAYAEQHITDIPDGVTPAVPGAETEVPCDIELRYDDGSDDTPGSGPTWGGPTPGDQWWIGVLFTPPADQSYEVQSVTWFSDFWVWPGNVNIRAYEVSNPSNETFGVVNVTDGGTWELEFAEPICVGPGSDYVIMGCPDVNVWGVIGQDTSGSDNRSSQVNENAVPDCSPDAFDLGDYMMWSCVTPCGPTPVEEVTWGSIKSLHK